MKKNKRVVAAMSPKQSLRLATGQAGGVRSKRVIVAMSGGVDSSVAAALLKERGYNVIGVFMKFWPQEGRCCSAESETRARLTAKKLEIPFYVFNFEKEFKKKVVDYFLKNSKSGLTPNPCVICNKEIKFGLLFKKLKSLNADYIATGHYAELRNTKRYEYTKIKNKKNSYIRKKFVFRSLFRAKDKNKDQSYFLWKLDQKILKKTLFPVGDYTKPEIKSLAQKFKLSFEDVPESQEVCFVQTNINDFLKKHLKIKPGPIIDIDGKVLGRHQGLWFYTIGQRKGIGLAGGPYYVLDKDLKKNILIITNNEKDLYKKELAVKNLNWISGKEPKSPLKVRVAIRYRHEPALALLVWDKPGLSQFGISLAYPKIKFFKPQKAVTPGQSAVFYLPAGRHGLPAGRHGQKNELLGGGIII